MLQALQAFSSEYLFTVDVVDVDNDDGLLAQYDELVPVLLVSNNGARPVQLCHYFLDGEKLKLFLHDAAAS